MTEVPALVWSFKSQKEEFVATSIPAVPQSEHHPVFVYKNEPRGANPDIFETFDVKCEPGSVVREEGQETFLNLKQAEWGASASVKLQSDVSQELHHAVNAGPDRDSHPMEFLHVVKPELNSPYTPLVKTEQDYVHNETSPCLMPKQEQERGVSYMVENRKDVYSCSARSVNIVKSKMNSLDITSTKIESGVMHSKNTEQSNIVVILTHSGEECTSAMKTEQEEIYCEHTVCSLKTEGILERKDEQPKSHRVTSKFNMLGWTGSETVCSDPASSAVQKADTSQCDRAAVLPDIREDSSWQETQALAGALLPVAIPDSELHKQQHSSRAAAVPHVLTDLEIWQAAVDTEGGEHSNKCHLKSDIDVDSQVTCAKPLPLKNHRKIHKSSRRCQGTRSNGVFQQTADPEGHMAHRQVTVHQCDECMASFRKSVDLQKHKPIHNDVKRSQCVVCKLAFRTSLGLRKHMSVHKVKTVHRNTVPKTTPKTSFRRHLVSQGDGKRHQCSVCQAAFKTISHLNRHKTIHSDVRTHRCTMCRGAFRTYSDLKEHMVIHSDVKAYQCGVCSVAFKRSKHLTQHMLIHRETKEQQCGVCKAAFRRASDMKRHLAIHDDVKPYQCSVCTAAFKRSSHLTRHVKTHSDSNPYRCKVCDASFKRSAFLKKHMLIHK